jgi:hypothetical protein
MHEYDSFQGLVYLIHFVTWYQTFAVQYIYFSRLKLCNTNLLHQMLLSRKQTILFFGFVYRTDYNGSCLNTGEYFYWISTVHLHMNVNNNLQLMHFLYIYYI